MGMESFEPTKAETLKTEGSSPEPEGVSYFDEQTETKQEQWNPEEALVEYIARNEEVNIKLSAVEKRLNSLHYEEGNDFKEGEIDQLFTERASLQNEKLTASANYPGDWTGLLHTRLTDPATKEKFITRRTEAMEHMQDVPNVAARREMPKAHYQEQIDSYDTNIQKVFSMTEVGAAESFGSQGRNLGSMGKENVGAVFSDAEHKGSPLTDRQKNIIEAHEKGHCLRDFASQYDRKEIQNTIDQDLISELNRLRKANGIERTAPTYVSNPMEIAERMAQFKNYFGMGANDKFEKRHLDYVREHYVNDTELDNGVSDLLYVVTPETEKSFLHVINKYPI